MIWWRNLEFYSFQIFILYPWCCIYTVLCNDFDTCHNVHATIVIFYFYLLCILFIGDASAYRRSLMCSFTVIAPEPMFSEGVDGKWMWSSSELFVYSLGLCHWFLCKFRGLIWLAMLLWDVGEILSKLHLLLSK